MSNDLSLGAAIYFDHDLSAEPAPLIRLLEALFGERAPTDSREPHMFIVSAVSSGSSRQAV